MSEESKTPRTDKQEFYECCGYEVDWVTFSRQLETELAKAKQALFKRCELEVELNHLDRALTYIYPDCGHAEELAEANESDTQHEEFAKWWENNARQWKAIAERLARSLVEAGMGRGFAFSEVKALADFNALREEGES